MIERNETNARNHKTDMDKMLAYVKEENEKTKAIRKTKHDEHELLQKQVTELQAKLAKSDQDRKLAHDVNRSEIEKYKDLLLKSELESNLAQQECSRMKFINEDLRAEPAVLKRDYVEQLRHIEKIYRDRSESDDQRAKEDVDRQLARIQEKLLPMQCLFMRSLYTRVAAEEKPEHLES